MYAIGSAQPIWEPAVIRSWHRWQPNVLDCSVDQVVTQGVDTDYSPYDTGSYASATTYVTGMAVVKACEILRKQIIEEASILMEVDPTHITFDGDKIEAIEDQKEMLLREFANRCFAGGKGKAS